MPTSIASTLVDLNDPDYSAFAPSDGLEPSAPSLTMEEFGRSACDLELR